MKNNNAGRKKTRYILKNKKRFLSVLLMIIIPILLLILASTVFGESISNNDEYIEITIKSGDTLWDIAAEHKDDDQDIRMYIHNIRSINKMKTSELFTGQKIMLPY